MMPYAGPHTKAGCMKRAFSNKMRVTGNRTLDFFVALQLLSTKSLTR